MKTILLLLALLPFVFANSAVIYKSESCGHCTPYVQALYPVLERNGFQNIQVKDFINDPQARNEVASIQQEFHVPLEMQGHMLTLLQDDKGKYLFEGHVQTAVVEGFLKSGERQDFSGIVVSQDSMDANAPSYTLLAPDGTVRQCSTATQSIVECEKQSVVSGDGTQSLLRVKVESNIVVFALLGAVLVALGLLQFKVLG